MRKELLLTNRFIYEQNLINQFIRLSGKNNIKEFNIPPCLLDDFLISPDITQKINLTLDFPFSQLDTASRIYLVSSFEEKYKNLINYYNLGIVPAYIEKNKLIKDLENIPHKNKVRIFIEWSITKDDDELYRILQTCDDLSFKNIIIGTNYKKMDVNQSLRPQIFDLDFNISLFGNLSLKDIDPRVKSLLYVPETIFNINLD